VSVAPGEARAALGRLRADAEAAGYHLNSDEEWTLGLIQGLLTNQERYGYQSCPCRLAAADKGQDLDIICPCDYRDADLHDYGSCYCALYVAEDVLSGRRPLGAVPERRPLQPPPREATAAAPGGSPPRDVPSPGICLWRCRVCGYLCAREHPPGVCPICKARAERFEPFVLPPEAIPSG
jgi:ferredoxin-thioredoxin reductase catalytic subunit